MNSLRVFAILLAASVVSSAGAAESKPAETKPTAPPSATATDLARALVPKDSWAAGVTQISQGVQQQMQSHPGSTLHYPPDFPEKIRAEVEKILPYDEFIALHAQQLSTRFSEAEMKDVLAFYRTPAGKKWQDDMPKATQAVSQETQKRFQQKMPDVMTRLAGMAQGSKAGGKATSGSPHGTAPPTKGGGK